MNWVAWKMLTGDRAKYLGIVFGVAFGSLLISQQLGMFVSIMRRTASQIIDVSEADIWVMNKKVQQVDDVRPMVETDLYRVRGIPGVDWAVRMYKGTARARKPNGDFRQVMLIGIDDASFVGAPREVIQGALSDLRKPDSVLMDRYGWNFMFGDEPFAPGTELEMNDRRAVVAGLCKASTPFNTMPVLYARYSEAIRFVPQERNVLSFVLVKAVDGASKEEVAARIGKETGLLALTHQQFMDHNWNYYMRSTGIPINFGITIMLGFIVGTAIAGQTFYLFVLENLKQFGSLKAMGLSNVRIAGMILLQAALVGLIGYGIGVGAAAIFFEATFEVPQMNGLYMPWEVLAVTGAAVAVICALAGMISMRKVWTLEPAVVFRG